MSEISPSQLDIIYDEVHTLLRNDTTGHAIDHIDRTYALGLKLAVDVPHAKRT